MKRDEILHILRRSEGDLKRKGVARAALFGSVARGDNGPSSDIDIMVEIAPGARMDVYGYVEIVQFLEELFPTKVDVANRATLHRLVTPKSRARSDLCFLREKSWRWSQFATTFIRRADSRIDLPRPSFWTANAFLRGDTGARDHFGSCATAP